MNRFRSALACAAALATVAFTAWLSPLPAKANTLDLSTWTDLNSGKCLGVYGGNMTNGTSIVQWTCNGNPDQTWEVQTVSGTPGNPTWTQIQNYQDPSKCLGVYGSGTSVPTNLVIWDCNGHADQEWQFVPWQVDSRGAPAGCFVIQNQNAAGKVIGVFNADTSDGAQTVIWDNLSEQGHHDQVWCPFALNG